MKKSALLLLLSCLAIHSALLSQSELLDETFDLDGKVITAGTDKIFALVIQPDQKILAAGYASTAGKRDFALTRYYPDGALDGSFGANGLCRTNFGSGDDEAKAMTLQPDGKIVVAGYAFNGTYRDVAIARYLEDGTLDASFGLNGLQTTSISPANDEGLAVALQPDGKIVVAGTSFSLDSTDVRFTLARFDAQGALDPGFGTGGTTTSTLGVARAYAHGVAVQPDGKIVVAGYVRNGSYHDFALARFLPDGTPDTGFGSGGVQTTDMLGHQDYARAVVLQPDGKIVLAGIATAPTQQEKFGLARYQSDGTLDDAFGTGGKVTTAISYIKDGAQAVLLQPDGKIVAAGYSLTPAIKAFRFAVARYRPDGTPDNSFAGTGKVTTAIQVGNDQAFAVALQADGKIVAAGHCTVVDFALTRYLPGTSVGAGEAPEAGPPVQAWPNPLEQDVTVTCTLNRAASVTLALFDVLGKKVCTLLNSTELPAGPYAQTFVLPPALAQGVYTLVWSSADGQAALKLAK